MITNTNMNIKNEWNEIEMAQAAHEFEVPACLKVVLVIPELFHCDVLLNHNTYKCVDGGVKTPCPWCGTNKL